MWYAWKWVGRKEDIICRLACHEENFKAIKAHFCCKILLNIRLDESQSRTFCGVSWKEKRLKMTVFIGFLAIFGTFSQNPDTSDSVIRWFESSYPSHFGIIRTSLWFARRSDYFFLSTLINRSQYKNQGGVRNRLRLLPLFMVYNVRRNLIK